ncbi:MAG: hypothetical protein JWM98_2716 [Thermoleophilia bacterium]|nr:hypothetical protein [Thermoleophilia bacterium]
MQPLPPTVTTQVLVDAARGFERAAGSLGAPTSAADLQAAARSAYQGIPSLRMTTVGSGALATQLRDAADAALALSDEIAAAPTGTDFSSRRDTILGWANLAADAAALVDPGYSA